MEFVNRVLTPGIGMKRNFKQRFARLSRKEQMEMIDEFRTKLNIMLSVYLSTCGADDRAFRVPLENFRRNLPPLPDQN